MYKFIIDIRFFIFFQNIFVLLAQLLWIAVILYFLYFLSLVTLEPHTGQPWIAMFKKMDLEVFLAVEFDYLQKNPESHVKFVSVNEEGPVDVLLDDIGFGFETLAVHFYAYFEGTLAQQFG